jgi:putative protease
MKYELLSPAGNFEKLLSAVNFGCDAVYLSGEDFSLRAKSNNFDNEELKNAIDFLHRLNKKGYVTVNIYARNEDFKKLPDYLLYLQEIDVDGVIVSDPGVFKLIRDLKIDLPIHISTQANTTNYMTVKFWEDLGVKRVVLARELSKREIEYICKNTSVEIEVFVHGAMCISHSGRCVLSNYMTKKDANRGECTHPCRWNYYLMEETRPGEFFPVFEDERGTYIYNSKDLCLLEYLKELMDMGVKSFKIEGRMKSSMYVSVVTGVYRRGIDEILKYGDIVDLKYLLDMLGSVSNRHFTAGFYSESALADSMNYDTSSYVRNTDYLGLVCDSTHGDSLTFIAKGKIKDKEEIAILNTDLDETKVKADLYNINGEKVDFTKPNEKYILKTEKSANRYAILRRYL